MEKLANRTEEERNANIATRIPEEEEKATVSEWRMDDADGSETKRRWETSGSQPVALLHDLLLKLFPHPDSYRGQGLVCLQWKIKENETHQAMRERKWNPLTTL